MLWFGVKLQLQVNTQNLEKAKFIYPSRWVYKIQTIPSNQFPEMSIDIKFASRQEPHIELMKKTGHTDE